MGNAKCLPIYWYVVNLLFSSQFLMILNLEVPLEPLEAVHTVHHLSNLSTVCTPFSALRPVHSRSHCEHVEGEGTPGRAPSS